MTQVFWTITGKDSGYYVVKFWTKADKSNALEFKTISLDLEKLRNKIISVANHDDFFMTYVKPQGLLKPPD